jgi:hypothetical protein
MHTRVRDFFFTKLNKNNLYFNPYKKDSFLCVVTMRFDSTFPPLKREFANVFFTFNCKKKEKRKKS